LSSHLSIIWERGWVGYHEAFDVGGGWCRTPSSGIGVPTWHDTADLRTFEVGCFAGRSCVVRTATETALSSLGTVDRVMVGEDFPTFVAKAGV